MNGHSLVKIEHDLSKLLDDMVLSGMTQGVEAGPTSLLEILSNPQLPA